jgi:hypothetical protein
LATFASTIGAPAKDGVPYSASVPLTSTEADLNNAVPNSVGSPVGVRFGEAVLAVVQLTAIGPFGSNAAYVILQTSVDGVVWVDVAGVLFSAISGTQTFVLAAGVAGALAQQQSRVSGTAPAANFANQMPLGGQIRFVGQAKTTTTSSSSSSSGAPASGVFATITFKLLGLR